MEKQRWEESEKRKAEQEEEEEDEEEEEEEEEEDQRWERQKKEDPSARKGRKVAKRWVFQCRIVAREGRKVGSLKRRVRSHLGRWEIKNCTSLWRKAHVEVKPSKTSHVRSFGSWDVQKAHAVVARSTCRIKNAGDVEEVHAIVAWSTCWSQNVEKVRAPCAKHMSKSKWQRHHMFGPLLEFVMLNNTTCGCGGKCVSNQNAKSKPFSDHFPKLRCRTSARRCGTKQVLKSKPDVRTTLGRSSVVVPGRRNGFCILSRMSKTWGLCGSFKRMAGVRRWKRVCKEEFRVGGAAHAVQET